MKIYLNSRSFSFTFNTSIYKTLAIVKQLSADTVAL